LRWGRRSFFVVCPGDRQVPNDDDLPHTSCDIVMGMTQRICVFCGSSSGIRPGYAAAAALLARHLVARRISIVYGGGKVGLMGTLADAALEAGGEVIGVIPRSLVEKEVAHGRLPDLRIVGSMHERKAQMAELSDAFIALPGGYGTFEEFCEILTWTQLGLQRKPCGILNVEGYYDRLLGLFDHAVAEGFLKPVHRQMVVSDTDPESLIERLLEYHAPVADKWIDEKWIDAT
jgi:uncharacterized protein (TIGR00730 family)